MKGKYKILFIVLFLISHSKIMAQSLSANEFQNPSREYAPMTWWHWVNGHVTKEGILKDLTALYKAGIRGVQVFNTHMYMPEGPVEYNSDLWLEMMVYAVNVCDSLGLKFVAMNCAGWSGSGGPWIDADKAMKKLVFSEITVRGDKELNLPLPAPSSTDSYLRDIAVLAIPSKYKPGQIENLQEKILMHHTNLYYTNNIPKKPSIPLNEILDLSEQVNLDGELTWNAPKGEWTILRFCYTLTGRKTSPAAHGGEGYEVDKLNPKHVKYQFQQSLGKLLGKTEKYLGNTFEGILFDSYEAGFQNWTETLPREFYNKFGYSLIDYLPLFSGRYVESSAKSEKVLSDYRDLLDNMLANHYYGTMQRMAHDNSLQTYAECQGGPVNTSLAINYVDIPMNEFWNPDAFPRLSKMRLTGSLATNRNKHIVAAEAFTSRPQHGKWQNTPWTLKKPGDLAFTTGINRFCFHTFIHQPVDIAVPGFTMGRYGTLFSRHSTWWEMGKEWIKYLTRCQHILQQGRRVTDLCFLFNQELRYAHPDSSVNVPTGFDYSVIYPQDLLTAKFEEGDLLLESGSRFKLIILPDDFLVEQSVSEKLIELVKAGCQLVCSQSSFALLGMGQSFNKTSEYIVEIGKGRIFVNNPVQSAINRINIKPDVYVEELQQREKLYFTHRETENEHIYFLSNQSENSFDLDISFKVNGLVPKAWDPAKGIAEQALPYKMINNTVKTHLSFDPYGSQFVVFSKDRKGSSEYIFTPVPVNTTKQSIVGPWQLNFTDKQQINESLQLDTLSSLHINKNERVKYYSGTMTYSTEFTLTEMNLGKSTSCKLDLGDIYNIAEVWVNGNKTGIVWKKPYNIDITEYIKEGLNRLEVTVANTWINRIIGDERIPTTIEYDHDGTRFTNGRALNISSWIYSESKPVTEKRFTFTTWQHYNEESELPPSGLVGPVNLILSEKREIKK